MHLEGRGHLYILGVSERVFYPLSILTFILQYPHSGLLDSLFTPKRKEIQETILIPIPSMPALWLSLPVAPLLSVPQALSWMPPPSTSHIPAGAKSRPINLRHFSFIRASL